MTRPLLDKTAVELDRATERNRKNKAELLLILAELRHRKTINARNVEAKAKQYLAECEALEGKARAAIKPDGAQTVASSKRESRLTGQKGAQRSRLDILHALVDRHWDSGEQLQGLVGSLAELEGSDAKALLARVKTRISALVPLTAVPSTGQKDQGPKPMNDERRWTEEAVAKLRTKLLDLTKKNPLISFKHGGRGALHLRFVDERPDLLFEALQEGTVGFEPLPDEEVTPKDETTPTFAIAYERARLTDPAFLAATEKLGDDERDARAWQTAERALRAEVRRQLGLPALEYGKTLDVKALALAHGFDPSYDLKASDDDDVADHHLDGMLRVLLTRKELDKRLKGIWDRYRTHARETGLHTLFLALGFVQWYEDDASDVALHAPLLLLPVALDRRVVRARYEYTLGGHDEGLQVNVALAEKMRQHFGLELPQLREDETPESYFVRVALVLEKGRRLSLRRFATLTVLPFPRMVLWKDLDPAMWSEAAFAQHALLPGLLGAKQLPGESGMGAVHDIDAAPWADRAPALIQPADASQHSALIDAAEGKSLAIEGPPGTGKSQTITNIIATALSAGKRVLFVAEKQAALAVVSSRLRQMGFGPLLLELHGDNANRTEVYNGLRERVAASVRSDSTALDAARRLLRDRRDLLRRYMALIDEKIGSLGRSAYWLVWREVNLRSQVDAAAADFVARRWKPGNVRAIDRATLADHRSWLESFGRALAALGSGTERTRWASAKRIGPFDQSQQLGAARRAAEAASAVLKSVAAIEALGVGSMPSPDGAVDEAVGQLEQLDSFGDVREVVACSALRNPDTSRALLARQARWRQLRSKLDQDVDDAAQVSEQSIDALERAIAAVEPLPSTVSACRERLEVISAAVALDKTTSDDRTDLVHCVGVRPATTVNQLHEITKVVASLEGADASTTALYRLDLLDPLTAVTLDRERSAASGLIAEHLQISALVTEESDEAEPSELDELANTLAESGAFARLLSGDYKRAKRRAARLIRTFDQRQSAADLLRRLARLKRQIAKFRAESPAAGFFPTALWSGPTSDWGALAEAADRLKQAHSTLLSVRNETVLPQWLGLPSHERSRLAAIARRLESLLATACEHGFGDHPAHELSTALDTEQVILQALAAALDAVGAKPSGVIIRDGESLPERLSGLAETQRDFLRLSQDPSFSWVTVISDPLEELARALRCADAVGALVGPLPVVEALRATEKPVATLDQLAALQPAFASAISEWKEAQVHLLEATGVPVDSFGDAPGWGDLADLFGQMAADEAGARLAADLLKYRDGLAERELEAFGHAAIDGVAAPNQLPDLYELLLLRNLISDYLGGDGAELGRLGSLTLDAARKAFVQVDKELHELEAKAIIAKRLGEKAPLGIGHGPKKQWTEMSLLESELALKKPRTPIRDLTERAGKSLQALKPVWMMSPASVAQFIRPDSLRFDLLVVDEASQMRPEYAIGAIMRGEQFVVVGDANQLPPTDFFSASVDDDDDGDDGVQVDTESILDLANQRLRNKRRLRWHYRSQHESLIQFSNREFYGRDLVVFPSPTIDDDLLGVKSVYVGGTYEASINEREAQAVIEEAFRLMRAYPQHSIGIATMNAKQTELIRNEFDRLILEAPEVRRYVDEYAGGIEEFFIKNLENVQGDERDIILISTVYGPDKNGTVAQRFGPMNREVGWRRLNVLVTRAKLSTRIFTSLRPDDIKVTETSSRGVAALKAYLTYAHKGATYDHAAGGEPDSDFEVFVGDALRGAGYDVVHQVGVEGFRIDLGVKHPDYPIGFIAGVECDGASFHSGLSVRDRDRIRQTILESMGWRIYRIWSTDWFADPQRERGKLLATLDAWRMQLAAEFAQRPRPVVEIASSADEPSEITSDSLEEAPTELVPPRKSDEAFELTGTDHEAPAVRSGSEEPTGREMRPLGDIAWYEVSKGRLYDVWLAGRFVGQVEVLSRAASAPRVYGGRLLVERSEYEGWVQATDERFKMHDIHGAVREVAARAKRELVTDPA